MVVAVPANSAMNLNPAPDAFPRKRRLAFRPAVTGSTSGNEKHENHNNANTEILTMVSHRIGYGCPHPHNNGRCQCLADLHNAQRGQDHLQPYGWHKQRGDHADPQHIDAGDGLLHHQW